MNEITASELFEMKGLNKSTRAYAFLYASFEASERSGSPIKDAFDCIAPFIIPYLNKIKGQQVDVSSIQSFLRASFFFDIPLYAIDQLFTIASRH